MVRIVAALIFLCIFFACRDSKVKSVAENVPLIKSDTFSDGYMNTLKTYEFKYPSEFDFDTVDVERVANDEHLVIPKLIVIKDAAIDKKLRKKILSIVQSFLTQYGDNSIDGYSKKIIQGTIDLDPVNTYRNKDVISYCFEICYSDSVLMRPYCHYDCLNYDIKKAKVIRFSDFFEIHSREDSLYFGQLILRAVNETQAINELSLYNKIDFSMNDNYIFFYFDAYELGAPFNIGGGIKRKYLTKFIKDEYQ